MLRWLSVLLICFSLCLAAQPQDANEPPAQRTYAERVGVVRSIPGLAAFWDFVQREETGDRFVAYTAASEELAYPLDAVNYVRDYWQRGREATYEYLPLHGRGPFGEAIQIRTETDPDFRPLLLLPRQRFHGTPLDAGGPGASVSMTVWMVRQAGNHAVAGIWHEGTDLNQHGPAARVERGRRQYAIFTGLAANPGASAVHVSENGTASFGDIYARNLATTSRRIPTAPEGASADELDQHWSVVGFVFDRQMQTATAYLDGIAEDYWIEDGLDKHGFFRWPAQAWKQAQARRIPAMRDEIDPAFPEDQLYTPPEEEPLRRKRVVSRRDRQVWELTYAFTKVRETRERKQSASNRRAEWEVTRRELLALRVNPFWFGHDLFQPASAEDGGPFTIGRVIHSGRSVGSTGLIGGVAVYARALRAAEMRRLAEVGFEGQGRHRRPRLLTRAELSK
jgi:hypothetical protein